MLAIIENLREIARRCSTGQELPAELSSWLAGSLEAFLSHRTLDLNEALGLRWPKGGVPWWLEEAIRQRNAALRKLADRLCEMRSLSAQARFIHITAARYAAANWLVDRQSDEMPSRYADTLHEWLWLAFKSGAPMPIGERQLRHILGD